MHLSRRQTLKSFASGFGTLALANLFSQESAAAIGNSQSAIGNPHFPPKAKRIIYLFMSGGPSHVDLFDNKPLLQRDHGKPLPFEMPKLVRTKTGNLLSSPWKGGGRRAQSRAGWGSAPGPTTSTPHPDLPF